MTFCSQGACPGTARGATITTTRRMTVKRWSRGTCLLHGFVLAFGRNPSCTGEISKINKCNLCSRWRGGRIRRNGALVNRRAIPRRNPRRVQDKCMAFSLKPEIALGGTKSWGFNLRFSHIDRRENSKEQRTDKRRKMVNEEGRTQTLNRLLLSLHRELLSID
jgi:hypothetical protein